MSLETQGKSLGMAGTRSLNNVVRTQLLSCLFSFPLCWLHSQADFLYLGAPKSSGLCLSYSYQSWGKEIFSLPSVPTNVLVLGLLGLIHLPIMEAIPVEDESEIYILSYDSGDGGVYSSI